MAYSHLPKASYSLPFYAILFLSCFLSKPSVFGARGLADRLHVGEMNSVALEAIPTTADKGPIRKFTGQGLDDRCGSGSPFGQEKFHHNSRQVLLQDQSASPQMSNHGEGIQLELRIDSWGTIFVTAGFGTPKRSFNLFFDTGSYLTWVQCQSCSGNCNPHGQFYDPSSSSTFSDAKCDSSCDFEMDYHDGSSSKGYYVKDTLSLTSTAVEDGFVFGCAQNISGDFGGADGMLGIGQGNYSLMAQSDTKYLSMFCYCLPAKESSKGYVAVGVQALETCQPDTNMMIPLVVSTEEDNFTSYSVQLLALTIGQQRLDMPSSSKTVIDSGTKITRLPPPVYSALRSAFQEMMSEYPLASATELLDTCYNLEGYKNWTRPNLMLHFVDSTNVSLDPSAVAVEESGSRVCLAFSDKDYDGVTIIGNQQLRELLLFYEIGNGRLSFGTGGCT